MNISQITYINLDFRVDKLNHILMQLKDINIPYFKTSGIISDDYEQYKFREYTVKHLSLEGNKKKYKGILGCFLAHKKAVSNLINFAAENLDLESDNYSLILEDDVIIDSDFWNFVFELPDLKDADMIFFDSGREKELTNFPMYCSDPVCYKNFYKSNPKFIGAHCYAIKNKKLQKILQYLEDVKEYKDPDGYYFDNKQFTVYCFQTGKVKINRKLSSDRLMGVEYENNKQ